MREDESKRYQQIGKNVAIGVTEVVVNTGVIFYCIWAACDIIVGIIKFLVTR